MEIIVKKKYVIDNLTRVEYELIRRLVSLEKHDFIHKLNLSEAEYELSVKMYEQMVETR